MAHCNTILPQLLKMVGRHEFEKIASTHHQGQRLRKTSRWPQFVALAFGQLSGRQSLRDIESNLQAQRQHAYHLGGAPIARSNLARLNNRQPASCYGALFYKPYARCAKQAPKRLPVQEPAVCAGRFAGRPLPEAVPLVALCLGQGRNEADGRA